MSELESFYEEYGATLGEHAGRCIAVDYGRPARTHRAVRNGVGVTEHPADVIEVTGADRVTYIDNVVSNRVPETEGHGCDAVLCDPQGRIETDMTVVNAGDRLLLFCPPGRGAPTVEGWEAFIQDVSFAVSTDRFRVFGVHGPQATPTLATVLSGEPPPETRYAFVRGEIADAGVSVIRTGAPAGETGYAVVCETAAAVDVVRTLVSGGPTATPFGRTVWDALTLEAGTPVFETELRGRLPNVAGIRSAVDFEKGCFVGQEVVSKVEHRGQPSRRLVGLEPAGRPEADATVRAHGESVGAVTRAAESPIREGPIALAYVTFDLDPAAQLTVDTAEGNVEATRVDLPFVEGSERSDRLPAYS